MTARYHVHSKYTIFSLEYVDFWAKIYLILHPSLEKLTTHITVLLGQVWPQWQVIKILKLMKEGNSQWRTEKEKLEREVSSLGNNFCFRFIEHSKFIQIR